MRRREKRQDAINAGRLVYYTKPGGTYPAIYDDMAKQPHLLIAGATGSGKSVVINGIIYAILHRMPGRLAGAAQLILIDPKRVELVQYKNLPHTIAYACSSGGYVNALNMALSIIETRYNAMAAAGLRKYPGGDVYVIIDELADLMLTDGKQIAPLIQRIAQIGRAAGVHCIAATQTPIVEVIPTRIKCNFDARVGLRARSASDSRNILGHAGLEKLPRYGQAVYMTPGGETRYNIPMIEDNELNAIVQFWLSQGRGRRTV